MTALKKILLSKKVYRNGLLKLDKRKDSKVGCNCSSSARTEVYKADQPGSRWSEEGSEHPTRRFVTPTRNHQKKTRLYCTTLKWQRIRRLPLFWQFPSSGSTVPEKQNTATYVGWKGLQSQKQKGSTAQVSWHISLHNYRL